MRKNNRDVGPFKRVYDPLGVFYKFVFKENIKLTMMAAVDMTFSNFLLFLFNNLERKKKKLNNE